MQLDETVAKLGEKLDRWLDDSFEIFGSQDRAVQIQALRHGIEIEKEITRLTAEALATLNALLNRREQTNERQQVESLIGGFEFGVKFAHALHDELLDMDDRNKIMDLVEALVEKLDSTDSGRSALAALLDHSDSGVRASAASSLVNLMPDRALPILREIDEAGGGTSADFTAAWALLAWERKQNPKAIGSQ